MLSLVKLADADYLINQVARGLDEYYVGAGEAPGVWHGRWAHELALDGTVDHDDLRALLDARHPDTGVDLVAGNRERTVKAFDATFSAPKSASLLWTFATDEVAAAVSIAHVESVSAALDVLEARSAVARQQSGLVRRRVPTRGLAVATFMHRTSRDGDPQLHTHCVIPNLVMRDDGSSVALDAGALYEWKRAAGCIYAEELRTRLSARLGVEWGPDRNGTREMVGFTPEQLRKFSKRTVAIEAVMATLAIDHSNRALVMRADEQASLDTRPKKDLSMTPARLVETWRHEAAEVGLPTGTELVDTICHRGATRSFTTDEVFAHLVDRDVGLCARRARFGEAHVVEAIASMGGGRFHADTVLRLSREFLGSDRVVRLMEPSAEYERPKPARWTTTAHLALERHVLARLDTLAAARVAGVPADVVDAAITAEGRLGPDQADAVRTLNAPGPALRALIAPAGYGKTTTVHAAAVAQVESGGRVLGLATTNQGAAELRDVGIPAMTLARLRIDVETNGLAPNTTLILDEVSQVATADAAWLLDTVVAIPGTQLWCLGDARQAQAVRAGGLAAEVERMMTEGTIPAATLTTNRRQRDAVERAALLQYRDGAIAKSQTIRTEAGWEHDCGTPTSTRQAMADAVVADGDSLGARSVVALVVSHADAEDLADRIRAIHIARGELVGETITGPAWTDGERTYAAGDLVLVHANVRVDGARLHNGTVLTVSAVTGHGMTVSDVSRRGFMLSREFVEGRRRDGRPNLSHAWARTVDGAQGGTWERVHLLGTAALDRYTGYVGQSRGRLATHTWNVTRLAEVDHGGVVVTRDPGAEVLSAMEREPAVHFATHDDPFALDRVLSAERAEHAAIIARQPAEVAKDLVEATERIARLTAEQGYAAQGLAIATRELRALGPLERVRRGGRDRVRRAEGALAGQHERTAKVERDLVAARAELARHEEQLRQRLAWGVNHGWRAPRMGEIDRQLAHHWRDAVLAVTRQDDPLAFGIDRLRHARLTTVHGLQALDAALPPDRAAALGRAERELSEREVQVTYAQRELAKAERRLEPAMERHWGRRDKDAVRAAERAVADRRGDVERAEQRVPAAARDVENEQRAVAEHARALEETATARAELTATCRDLSVALDETRTARVLAAADRPEVAPALIATIGVAPADAGGRSVWCGIAEQVERECDRTAGGVSLGADGSRARGDDGRLARLVADANELIDHAGLVPQRHPAHGLDRPAAWREALSAAEGALETARPLVVERDLSRGIGW